jgi:hypothetical protein
MTNTNHRPEAELAQRLRAAGTYVQIGAYYVHYKHPELPYKVMGVVIWEATDEVAVLYQAQHGERISFARTLSSWLESVEWKDQIVPRFTQITAR